MKKKTSKIYVQQEEKNTSKPTARSKKVAKTAQDTIPFDEIYENGIFRKDNTYIIIFKFENIDYKIKREQEKDNIYDKYQHLLNTLPLNIRYQEFIMNIPVSIDSLNNALIPTYSSELCDRKYYDDHCKTMQQIVDSTMTSSCEQMLIGAMSYQPTTKLDNPDVLFKYLRDLQTQALELNIKISQLRPENSFQILHKLYHYCDNEQFLLPTDFLNTDVQLKDYIAPSSFIFRSKFIEVGNAFSCVLFVKRFSRTCDDEFITDLLDNPYNVTVSKHLQRIDKDVSLDMLKEQMNDLQGRIDKRKEINHKRSGESGFIPWSLKRREQELTELEQKLSGSDCDLFEFAIYIYVSAKTKEELTELCEYIRLTARKHQVTVDVITGTTQQEKGLKCIVPFANPALTSEKQYLGQPFYMPTDEVANFIPFSHKNVINPNGICYGINPVTKLPIIIDRSEGLNANGFIMGMSGGGKSMQSKYEFWSAIFKYHSTDEFIYIDPEGEYSLPAQVFGGQVVKISPNTKTYINLFDTDLSYSDDEANAITMKSDFIMTFCECAKGQALSANERTVIDRCVRLVYADYLRTEDKSYIPTLKEFYKAVTEQEETEAKDIALSIELYVNGNFDIFAHHTNVDLKKRLIVFDISDIGNQLKSIGLLVLLETLWQRVIDNRKKGVRTWVTCDEFSVMYNDNSGVFKTGEFFEKVYQRIRKYGGVATGLTQNITQVLNSPQATNMLQNANFLILLAQEEGDLKKLKTMYKLSDNQLQYIDTDEPGKGLIKMGKNIIPFENKIDKSSLMYKICSTKLKDMQKLQYEGVI